MNVAFLLVLLFFGVLVIGGIAVSLSASNSLKQRLDTKRMDQDAMRGARGLLVIASVFSFFVARGLFEELIASNQWPLSDKYGGSTTFGIFVALLIFAVGSFAAGRRKQ